jgi:hypothetical protein
MALQPSLVRWVNRHDCDRMCPFPRQHFAQGFGLTVCLAHRARPTTSRQVPLRLRATFSHLTIDLGPLAEGALPFQRRLDPSSPCSSPDDRER